MRARSRKSGFTLLELAIVLALISVIVGGGLMMLTANIQATAYNTTVARMDAIEKALLNFSVAMNRLPCPADATRISSDQYYGVEAGSGTPGVTSATMPNHATGNGVCSGSLQVNISGTWTKETVTPLPNFVASNGAVEGGVPTRALKLSDDYMYDGWGNRFRYAVDPSSTATGALPVPAGGGCTVGASPMTVNDSTGANRTTLAAYVLVSHGANGHGAYTSSGATLNTGSINPAEQANCHCNNSGVSNGYPLTSYQPSGTATGFTMPTYVAKAPTIDSTNALDNFDDIVTFKEAWQLQTLNSSPSASASCVIVSDTCNNQVLEYTTTGTFVRGMGNGYTGTPGTPGHGQFSSPEDIAVDHNGNIWVVDSGNNVVQEFTRYGVYVNQFGTYNTPSGITMDSAGNFYVFSNDNSVHKVNSSFGAISSFTPAFGTTAGKIEPYYSSIGVDSSGNIWLNDNYNSRVEQWNSSYVYQASTTFGTGYQGVGGTIDTQNTGPGQLSWNVGIAFDSAGNILIADYNNGRIQKFNNVGVYQSQFTTTGAPLRLTLDTNNNIWVTSQFAYGYILEYTESGTPLMQINMGANACPVGIALAK